MAKLAKTQHHDPKKPADIAQVTFLMDKSGSMSIVEAEARSAIKTVMSEFAQKDGMVFSIRFFDSILETISDFGADLKNTKVNYRANGGQTFLFKSIADCVSLSVDDAALTPDIKVHHVLVVITDGEDSRYNPVEIDACKKIIEENSVNATYIMLDFSDGGLAGNPVGLKGIPFSQDPAEFKKAMAKVAEAIGQIADNVVKQLPPESGLCLPPSR